MKEHRLRIPEIDRDLKIDLRRPSVGARKIADFQKFPLKSQYELRNNDTFLRKFAMTPSPDYNQK